MTSHVPPASQHRYFPRRDHPAIRLPTIDSSRGIEGLERGDREQIAAQDLEPTGVLVQEPDERFDLGQLRHVLHSCPAGGRIHRAALSVAPAGAARGTSVGRPYHWRALETRVTGAVHAIGGVAQLVEQLVCNQQVAGSSPVSSTLLSD